mgnify:CR=1 FL=1
MYFSASSASLSLSSLSSGAGLRRYAGPAYPSSCLPSDGFQMKGELDACPRSAVPGVGNHPVSGKDFRRPLKYLFMIIGQCPVKTFSVTYLCNHFFSYSLVKAIICLLSSISSRVAFSSL